MLFGDEGKFLDVFVAFYDRKTGGIGSHCDDGSVHKVHSFNKHGPSYHQLAISCRLSS